MYEINDLDEKKAIMQYAVPEYHELDPFRPLGAWDSRAKLINTEPIETAYEPLCTRAKNAENAI